MAVLSFRFAPTISPTIVTAARGALVAGAVAAMGVVVNMVSSKIVECAQNNPFAALAVGGALALGVFIQSTVQQRGEPRAPAEAPIVAPAVAPAAPVAPAVPAAPARPDAAPRRAARVAAPAPRLRELPRRNEYVPQTHIHGWPPSGKEANYWSGDFNTFDASREVEFWNTHICVDGVIYEKKQPEHTYVSSGPASWQEAYEAGYA